MNLQKYKKYKRLYYSGIALFVIILLSVFISSLISVDSQIFYMAVVLTALPLILINLALLLAGALLTNKYRALDLKEVLNNVIKYAPLPYREINDYMTELEIVRKNFASDVSENKNAVDVKKINKGLIYKKLKTQANGCFDLSVLKSGKIYYGYVVNCYNLIDTLAKNANKFGIITVLYSPEEDYESNPSSLKDIYEKFCNCENDKLNAAKVLSEPIINNFKLPSEICGGREIYITSIFAERRQLPTGYISNAVLPIIASPLNSTSAFVVDCKYWSDGFIGNFAYRYDTIKYPEYNRQRISAFSEKRCGDYAKELDEIREKFTADEINAPVDLLGDNPFPSFEFSNLKIFYSYILDADGKKREGEPYVGICSKDEYFKANPKELITIAKRIKNDKNESKNINNVINYRYHAINTFTLPRELTDGRTVIMTAVFVEKDKLPLLRFDGNLLPVLSFGGEDDDWIYLADCKYWSDGFTYEYVNADKEI